MPKVTNHTQTVHWASRQGNYKILGVPSNVTQDEVQLTIKDKACTTEDTETTREVLLVLILQGLHIVELELLRITKNETSIYDQVVQQIGFDRPEIQSRQPIRPWCEEQYDHFFP